MIEAPFHVHMRGGTLVTLKRIPGVTKKGVLHEPFYFQVAPLEEFGWDASGNWTDYQTISGGTFTRGGSRGLRTLTLTTMAVEYNPTWAARANGKIHHDGDFGTVASRGAPRKGVLDLTIVSGGGRRGGRNMSKTEYGMNKPDPYEMQKRLQWIEAQTTPIMLVAVTPGNAVPKRSKRNKRKIIGYRHRPDFKHAVTLRGLSVRERAGEPDARYFDLSFTEYRRPQLRRQGYSGDPRKKDLPVNMEVGPAGIAREVNPNPTGNGGVAPWSGYVVGKKGSPATLRKLAKFFYGESSEWKRIAARNGLKDFGPSESLAKLPRRGRKTRRLIIPRLPPRGAPTRGRGNGGVSPPS